VRSGEGIEGVYQSESMIGDELIDPSEMPCLPVSSPGQPCDAGDLSYRHCCNGSYCSLTYVLLNYFCEWRILNIATPLSRLAR
jgi:hypothetical protein